MTSDNAMFSSPKVLSKLPYPLVYKLRSWTLPGFLPRAEVDARIAKQQAANQVVLDALGVE